ncbi:conjugal transfer protein [Roseburia sp. AF34-16]|uniref:cysteine-rich KTR domain-containing protein n=1 Tax=Roseburia sp. AF34-16 TaxID=2293136 RepID=UPI000E48105C|nr:cysteine-rich KTR domain-containing protein [Roseburia sp. AF34-16]RGF60635.1 conjugal transfer protein [Roseburia sp. AF34-16]DAG40684.1 MAG TPA: cysteine-rich protein [Caudoviricetes sp.]DAQ61821.1 MAG TPA: cysteine-rich protein [Caudoviricetes sp.]DAR36832.1 MAG TPA: cysteine-rich protein [Caudoviricetes sp.]
MKITWYSCPRCGNPHFMKLREDTKLRNFPAYCKKCKNEILITIEPLSRVINS